MKLIERTQIINPSRITGNDKFNLLIIEDDEQIRDALELSFQIYWPESKVEFYKLGKDGLQAAKVGIFDAILLDIILPDISGFEVLTNIRSFSNTPVIIFTADHNPENVKKAHALGANDLILKPYKQKELLTSIKRNIDVGACIN
jgi:DNA-binding response OmpR family regulator